MNVSVVVPAFNEESNLRLAIDNVIKAAAAANGTGVQIIIVNDGSADGTAAVADELAREYPFVHAVYHAGNEGFGAAFLSGRAAAQHDWITLCPADNVVSVVTLRDMLSHAGKADLVCAYLINTEARTRLRSVISSLFTFIYTATFNVHLRQIHATPVYPVGRLRSMQLHCRRYSFPSEITIKLLRQGCTFMELQGYMNPVRKSSALKLKNLVEVVRSYVSLIFEVYVVHRAEFSHTPTRVIPEEARL